VVVGEVGGCRGGVGVGVGGVVDRLDGDGVGMPVDEGAGAEGGERPGGGAGGGDVVGAGGGEMPGGIGAVPAAGAARGCVLDRQLHRCDARAHIRGGARQGAVPAGGVVVGGGGGGGE